MIRYFSLIKQGWGEVFWGITILEADSKKMFIFVSSKDEDKLYVPKAMTIWSKGPSIESCEGDQSASGAT